MKYFLDTEFIEGFHKPFLGKRRHFIDLISIGIVAEDGREYYAISNEYDYKKCHPWVKENVILPLYKSKVNGDARNVYHPGTFHRSFGKSNEQIKLDILEFTGCWRDQFKWKIKDYNIPEVYAYYADYDWVLFCSLFGRMIDLPEGFPMYCIDLKQSMDHAAMREDLWDIDTEDKPLKEKIKIMKTWDTYPAPENEHSAIDDARWNKKLYEFLQTI